MESIILSLSANEKINKEVKHSLKLTIWLKEPTFEIVCHRARVNLNENGDFDEYLRRLPMYVKPHGLRNNTKVSINDKGLNKLHSSSFIHIERDKEYVDAIQGVLDFVYRMWYKHKQNPFVYFEKNEDSILFTKDLLEKALEVITMFDDNGVNNVLKLIAELLYYYSYLKLDTISCNELIELVKSKCKEGVLSNKWIFQYAVAKVRMEQKKFDEAYEILSCWQQWGVSDLESVDIMRTFYDCMVKKNKNGDTVVELDGRLEGLNRDSLAILFKYTKSKLEARGIFNFENCFQLFIHNKKTITEELLGTYRRTYPFSNRPYEVKLNMEELSICIANYLIKKGEYRDAMDYLKYTLSSASQAIGKYRIIIDAYITKYECLKNWHGVDEKELVECLNKAIEEFEREYETNNSEEYMSLLSTRAKLMHTS